MKCLSMSQPWASLVVLGAKQYETRGWQTAYRGPLAIHASRTFPATARGLLRITPFRDALARAGLHDWQDLPTGLVIGVVCLVDCKRVEEVTGLSADELAFGDYRPGRWAWTFTLAHRLPSPFPWRGNLGLFDVPNERLLAGRGPAPSLGNQ
jgi:hypothetical protein